MGGGEVVMRGVCMCERGKEGEGEREVTLSISSAPALWFLWGTDVHNLIQCLIPLYSLSPVPAPPTVCEHTQTRSQTHTQAQADTHTHTHTHIVSWERQSYIAATFSYECAGVYSPAYWGHFTVCFPLCSGCVSCSWVNTWYNQVSLPPLSVCTSVGQLWPWAQRSYSARQSGQRKQMRALTIPLSKQKLIVQKWVVLKSSCSLVKVSHALCSLSICRFSSGTYKQRILGAISLRFNPIFLVLLHLLGYVIWAWSLEAIFCLAQKTKPVSIWSI